MWAAYARVLDAHPLRTKVITSAALLALGDVLAQFAIEKRDIHRFDGPRCARSAILGAVMIAPSLHYWYGFLGSRVTGVGLGAGIKRMLVDQTVFAPSLILGFFVGMGLLEAKSPAEIQAKVVHDYWEVLKGNYILWPAAQLINFTFVPPKFAVLYVNGVSVIWNSWLCYVNAREVVVNTDKQ